MLQARLVTNNHHLVKREMRFNPDEDYGSLPESETSAGEDEYEEQLPNYHAELEDADLDRDSPGDAMLSKVGLSMNPQIRKDDKIVESRKQQKRPERNVVLRKSCKNQVGLDLPPALLGRSLPPSLPPSLSLSLSLTLSRLCCAAPHCIWGTHRCRRRRGQGGKGSHSQGRHVCRVGGA